MTETSERTALAEVTAKIVSAYVSNNKLSPADLGALITTVAGQMAKVGTEVEPPAEERPEPAVSVRRSIQPDHLICLVCGQQQKMLKRHLAVKHDLAPAQYREHFGLKPDYPMAAPNYSQQRRDFALKIGLGQPKKPARRGRKGPGRPRKAESRQSEVAEAR